MREEPLPGNPSQSPSIIEAQSAIQSQTSLQNSYTRKGLIKRADVFVPLVFHRDGFIQFKRKHLLFLNAWKENTPLEKAANDANLTVAQARRFLARKDVRAWLADLSQEAAIKRDWDRPEKWYAKGNELLSQTEVPDHVIKVWQEFGDRAVPKPSRNAPSDRAPQIQININPAAVEQAFHRREQELHKTAPVKYLIVPAVASISTGSPIGSVNFFLMWPNWAPR